MQTYLVTGAAGFIGSAITTALAARGETVRALDNLTTGSLKNLAPVRDKIHFTPGDLRDEALLARLCAGVDVIFHQAAIASVQQSIDDPIGTWDVNVEGTRKLIAAARHAGVSRIVFASSSAVYGDCANQPVDEDNAFRPLSPYASQKLACELLLQKAQEESPLQTVCLRYFNVFGPRQSATSPYSGAIARFFHVMNRREANVPVTIFGDGSSTRDFVFIDDVVRANLAAANLCDPSLSGCSFNIGSGSAQTINHVAGAIAILSNFSGPIAHQPARPGDIRHSAADITAARKTLNYHPQTSFEEGLRQTHTWLRQTMLQAQTRKHAALPLPVTTISYATAN